MYRKGLWCWVASYKWCRWGGDAGCFLVVVVGLCVGLVFFGCVFFYPLQTGLCPWHTLLSLDLIAVAVLERGNLENLLHNALGKLNV